MTKYIFVTGGVVSSLGKGLTCASVGMLLEQRGLRIRFLKLDPYINIDPGLLSPSQQGEVYVLDDGSMTDSDLGHYERFTKTSLTWNSSWTTGQIYQRVFEREKRGEYNGAAIQVIPHITDEIKERLKQLSGPGVDVVITEIGGTVGDIESLPHLEAIRQFSHEIGKDQRLFIHLTLIPYLKAAKEQKTKPTQHSVGQLRQIGIQPDILICRTEHEITEEERAKIGLFCNIKTESVIEERDKNLSIYELPIKLHENKLDALIAKKFQFDHSAPLVLEDWYELLYRIRNPRQELTVALVGELAHCRNAYKSIYEALDHAGAAHQVRVHVVPVPSMELQANHPQNEARWQNLLQADAIVLVGSFGETEIDGKLEAVRLARENGIPFLGIGLGMQCAIIEYARNVLGLPSANSTEYDGATPYPVICLLDEYRSFTTHGGSLKVGADTVLFKNPSRLSEAYGQTYGQIASERFCHRYDFNNQYREQWEQSGMTISATSHDGVLVRAVEIFDHPWFVATQFHPEFKSKPTAAHPLFSALIATALERKK